MTWPVVLLLVGASGLATAGAVVILGRQSSATEEGTARRAIVGLGLLTAAAAMAAVGAALVGAGGTGPDQVGAFAGASATVLVPLLAVALTRRTR